MLILNVDDIVEYQTTSGDPQRGTVVEVSGFHVKVEYSPWGDHFWATPSELTLVSRGREGLLMAIEARGGKHAYVYAVNGSKRDGVKTIINHSMVFDTANSDDEAYGRAMKIAQKIYPQSNGWSDHFASVKCISGIDSVGRHNLSMIEAVE